MDSENLKQIADAMGPYFSPIVVETGTLEPEQMRAAIKKAYYDGVITSMPTSDEEIQVINEAYVEGPDIE